ncbi:predicted protein [Uncinocarpus reesii 1704]|uniref:Uncharacterized protein n=1 Tax=Uncinocarpus reesii (strain UAMH 1704) TaxID=336963 RepID=C4JLD7_UNCRE|nr:uncharacterized protein UREG_03645 [Uncinocarpus reesii 1704]EEP78799.1 predicted protein [Uncinocarpus reesii 1704]
MGCVKQSQGKKGKLEKVKRRRERRRGREKKKGLGRRIHSNESNNHLLLS